jgi:translocation and assembly module TamA
MKRTLIFPPLLIALLGILMPLRCLALDYNVTIDAPSTLQPLLNDHLPLMSGKDDPDLDAVALDALVRSTPDAAKKLLETEGYFASEVTIKNLGGTPARIEVSVHPGAAVTVSAVTLQLIGSVQQAADYADRLAGLRQHWPLAPGSVFRQAQWSSGKNQALQSLLADHYPQARISDSRMEIDPVSRQARVYLTLDSGPEVRFGAMTIRGLSRYPKHLVEEQADFHAGDPYQLQSLMAFQSALQQSAQFSSAIVSADVQQVVDGQIPVEVVLTELPKKKLDLGITYDSDVGTGARIGYEHYNLFDRGWTGSSVLLWDRSKQSLGFGLGLPRGSDGYVHTLSALLKKTDIQGLVTESNEFGIWRTHTRERDELRFGVEYIVESEHVNGQATQTNRALMPTAGWTLRTVDSLLHPRSGALLDATLSATPGALLSSTSFVRAYGRSALYWSPRPAWGTWMARLELGQVWSPDSSQVPASRLFRAGGVNSVRGYDYQSLGLAGADGAVIGGAVLATATLEYQIPLAPDWALALFTDAGDAAQSWQTVRIHRSRGIGVRWFSPVAPFSFDLAQAHGNTSVMWHMSLGLAF